MLVLWRDVRALAVCRQSTRSRGAQIHTFPPQVLSADAFSAFEEVGLDHDEEVVLTGHRFRDTVSMAASLLYS